MALIASGYGEAFLKISFQAISPLLKKYIYKSSQPIKY